MNKKIKRLIPFIVLFVLITLVYLSNFHEIFTLDWIRKEEQQLKAFVSTHPIISPVAFIACYILSVCLVIPDSTLLTLIGGLVFPFPLALIYSVLSETIGAIIFYWIFKKVLKTSFLKEKFAFLSKFHRKFHQNQACYLLFLRLSHIFPFWLTNITASYFRIPLTTFVWTTLAGVLPLTYILTDAGNSLSQLFSQNQTLTISDIFTFQVKLSLFVLGLLSLVPILYKAIKKRS